MNRLFSHIEKLRVSTVRFPSSLKFRILAFTGSVLVFLLLVISQVLLFQWREAIIAKEYDAVTAVSKTFSVTVIDALIREAQSPNLREGVLQTYVNDFINSMGNIKYVVVTDDVDQPLATAPPQAASAVPVKRGQRTPSVRIFDDKTFSWVTEVHLPLRIAQKSWGAATIGFDATPIREEIGRLFVLLFFITMAVTSLTLLVLYFLASRLTSSLNTLVRKWIASHLNQATHPLREALVMK